MYKIHTTCRACGYGAQPIPTLKQTLAAGTPEVPEKMITVFDLGVQPLANDFSKDGHCKGWAPLRVLFCPRCTLAQLSVTVDPAVLYSNYPYVTSTSRMMHEHFHHLIEVIKREGAMKNVLEIGSNDGAFLLALKDHSERVMGIDPAENLGDHARLNGVKTITALWDEDSAKDAANWFFPAVDVIIARHVFCHVDDWRSFIKCLDIPSNEKTLVCIEVPYVKDLLDRGEFDTIYHEHTSYLSLHAMGDLLVGSNWHIHNVVSFEIHGGAILIMLRRDDSGIDPHPRAGEMYKAEVITKETWNQFETLATSRILALQSLVHEKRSAGQIVAGYGASAKSTVMINACGWSRQDIAFICDNTPSKQLCFSPGNDIPITDEGRLTRDLPDWTVCFSWNYWPEIYGKEKVYRDQGKRWIVPNPEVKIC